MSSTTTYIMAPAAKAKAYGRRGSAAKTAGEEDDSGTEKGARRHGSYVTGTGPRSPICPPFTVQSYPPSNHPPGWPPRICVLVRGWQRLGCSAGVQEFTRVVEEQESRRSSKRIPNLQDGTAHDTMAVVLTHPEQRQLLSNEAERADIRGGGRGLTYRWQTVLRDLGP
ncbi:unnamed protein product [Nezara viridula]|uniref:Uncharacterized protein n=1 Tax=Nezara viridula TaxID=85310 RepID=A0A9P0HB89_NEZVI|nr:unnamed protein product [Nezara viridula]